MGFSLARCCLALIIKGTAISARFDAIIIGGGPSGSSAAIGLAGAGMHVALIEKKTFPREVLCGEFLSHEVTGAIRRFGLYDEFRSLGPNRISAFTFIPQNGIHALQPLGFEAWSMKRSLLDHMLLRRAEACGATIVQPAEVTSVNRSLDGYDVVCKSLKVERCLSSGTVIAAYGRHNLLDKSLTRSFVSHRSGTNGVKYHVPRSAFVRFPVDEIQLFAAEGIYCGVNRVSASEATLCFLAAGRTHTLRLNDALTVLLKENRRFRELFQTDLSSELRRLSPHGAGNIFFGKRKIVENGIFMIGDAAAVIAPLAGDGIGMAIESGQLLANVLARARRDSLDRRGTEMLYSHEWGRLFRRRLAVASYLQTIAMKSFGANMGGRLLKVFPGLAQAIVRWTRS